MDYFHGALFWILVGVVSSQWVPRDGRTRAITCFNQIMAYGDVTNLLIDVNTPQTIDDFCRHHDELVKCTKDNEYKMSAQEFSEYQKNISGVNNFHVQLCPPGTDITADYKANAACFKWVSKEILYCGSDLPDVNSYRMKNDLPYRCCALELHRECIKENIRQHCGEPAADVAEKILLRYFDRQIKSCKTPSQDCEYGGHSSVDDWTTSAHRRGTTRTYYRDATHVTEKNWRRGSTGEDWEWSDTTEHDGHDDAATETDWVRTTPEDEWVSVDATEAADERKRRHKHSGAPTSTLAMTASVLGCLASIMALRL